MHRQQRNQILGTSHSLARIFLLLTLVSCGKTEDLRHDVSSPNSAEEFTIRDGTDKVPETYQHVIPLYLGDDFSKLCRSVMIADDIAITAAHCTEGLTSPRQVMTLDAAGSQVRGSTIVNHALYPETIDVVKEFRGMVFGTITGDLDMTRFEKGLDRGTAPFARQAHQARRFVVIVGYGQDRASRAGTQRLGFAKVVTHAYSHTKEQRYAGNMIVIPRPNISCPGDSGGPAFNSARELVGILSLGAGLGTCATTVSNTYMNVSATHYRTWMVNVRNYLNSCNEACVDQIVSL